MVLSSSLLPPPLPLSPITPPFVSFLLLFTVNMGAAGVYTGKEKREQNELVLRLLSPVRAKNTPLRALPRPSSHPFSPRSLSLSPFLFRLVPSSSLFLDLRSTRLPRSQSSRLPPPVSLACTKLAINKKRKKKENTNENGVRARVRDAGVSAVE